LSGHQHTLYSGRQTLYLSGCPPLQPATAPPLYRRPRGPHGRPLRSLRCRRHLPPGDCLHAVPIDADRLALPRRQFVHDPLPRREAALDQDLPDRLAAGELEQERLAVELVLAEVVPLCIGAGSAITFLPARPGSSPPQGPGPVSPRRLDARPTTLNKSERGKVEKPIFQLHSNRV
jgi:hypothetical protein